MRIDIDTSIKCDTCGCYLEKTKLSFEDNSFYVRPCSYCVSKQAEESKNGYKGIVITEIGYMELVSKYFIECGFQPRYAEQLARELLELCKSDN